jgi:cAMP phosphodiesterase
LNLIFIRPDRKIEEYTTKDLLLKTEKITSMELVAVNNGKKVGKCDENMNQSGVAFGSFCIYVTGSIFDQVIGFFK